MGWQLHSTAMTFFVEVPHEETLSFEMACRESDDILSSPMPVSNTDETTVWYVRVKDKGNDIEYETLFGYRILDYQEVKHLEFF